MGAFDQAARYAAKADPVAVTRLALRPAGLGWAFAGWLDTRALPLPGGPDRTADLVAALDAVPPTVLLFEFQSRHDPDKLDATLEQAGILRARSRGDGGGKYRVLAVLAYLRGRCPDGVLDMTAPGGFGTRHVPLVWNVADDSAADAVEAVAAGAASWGTLFWVPLMAGGGDDAAIARWREVVAGVVPERSRRGDLAGVAMVLADLVGRRGDWKRNLEGFEMTESVVVNEWLEQGEARGLLTANRQNLLRLLNARFPGAVPEAVTKLVNQTESVPVLHHWFDAALSAFTLDQFLAELRK